jgi:hypothetical protein
VQELVISGCGEISFFSTEKPSNEKKKYVTCGLPIKAKRFFERVCQ